MDGPISSRMTVGLCELLSKSVAKHVPNFALQVIVHADLFRVYCKTYDANSLFKHSIYVSCILLDESYQE